MVEYETTIALGAEDVNDFIREVSKLKIGVRFRDGYKNTP